MISNIKNESNPCADNINKAYVDIIDKLEKLNELGCSFFLDANESHKTIMISSEVRWLTANPGKKRNYNTQQKANAYIKEVLEKYGQDSPKMNMQILLCTNPTKIKSNEHIVQLIKAGVDIRYKKVDNTVKICHRENTLFISYAHKSNYQVDSGIKYVSNNSNDPFIKRHTTNFEKDFENAQKVIIDKNGKLTFADKPHIVWFKAIKEIEKKDILIAVISAVLGGLIALLLKINL